MEQTLVALVFAGLGVIFCTIAIPLIQGKVARNGIYGFRTPKTLSSDRYWFPANRYMGRDMFVAGIAIAVGSLIMLAAWPMLGLSPENIAFGGTALVAIPVAITMYRGFNYLRRLV